MTSVTRACLPLMRYYRFPRPISHSLHFRYTLGRAKADASYSLTSHYKGKSALPARQCEMRAFVVNATGKHRMPLSKTFVATDFIQSLTLGHVLSHLSRHGGAGIDGAVLQPDLPPELLHLSPQDNIARGGLRWGS